MNSSKIETKLNTVLIACQINHWKNVNKTDVWIYIDITSFLSKWNLKYKDLRQLKIILSQLFTTELFKKMCWYHRNVIHLKMKLRTWETIIIVTATHLLFFSYFELKSSKRFSIMSIQKAANIQVLPIWFFHFQFVRFQLNPFLRGQL